MLVRGSEPAKCHAEIDDSSARANSSVNGCIRPRSGVLRRVSLVENVTEAVWTDVGKNEATRIQHGGYSELDRRVRQNLRLPHGKPVTGPKKESWAIFEQRYGMTTVYWKQKLLNAPHIQLLLPAPLMNKPYDPEHEEFHACASILIPLTNWLQTLLVVYLVKLCLTSLIILINKMMINTFIINASEEGKRKCPKPSHRI